MKDSHGLVCEPLKNGGKYCRLHLQLFCTRPTYLEDSLLFYLDFESSGLDVLSDHIVEIGVLCETLECFYTVVCPLKFADGPNVHGIEDEELREGPSFSEAFWRLYRFCENISEMAMFAEDSSDDEASPVMLKETPPEIVIVAHNGIGIIMYKGYKYGLTRERL